MILDFSIIMADVLRIGGPRVRVGRTEYRQHLRVACTKMAEVSSDWILDVF